MGLAMAQRPFLLNHEIADDIYYGTKEEEMANCSATLDHDLFLDELNKRINFLPIKSTKGNDCISIDMRCSSEKFFMRTDEFLKINSEFFNLLVTGDEYYLEVLNFSIFTNVRKHKYRDCSNS